MSRKNKATPVQYRREFFDREYSAREVLSLIHI